MFISFVVSLVFLWVATQLYQESEGKATRRMEKNMFYYYFVKRCSSGRGLWDLFPNKAV